MLVTGGPPGATATPNSRRTPQCEPWTGAEAAEWRAKLPDEVNSNEQDD